MKQSEGIDYQGAHARECGWDLGVAWSSALDTRRERLPEIVTYSTAVSRQTRRAPAGSRSMLHNLSRARNTKALRSNIGIGSGAEFFRYETHLFRSSCSTELCLAVIQMLPIKERRGKERDGSQEISCCPSVHVDCVVLPCSAAPSQASGFFPLASGAESKKKHLLSTLRLSTACQHNHYLNARTRFCVFPALGSFVSTGNCRKIATEADGSKPKKWPDDNEDDDL